MSISYRLGLALLLTTLFSSVSHALITTTQPAPQSGGDVQFTVSHDQAIHPDVYNIWFEVDDNNDGIYQRIDASLNRDRFNFTGTAGDYSFRVLRCAANLSPTANNSEIIETVTVAASTTSIAFATQGSASVDAYGGANYQIPFTILPGIEGMQPNLGLHYNSRNATSLVGMGWSLTGLSSIHRCDPSFDADGYKKSSPHSNQQRFCLDGQKLVAIAGIYGADLTEYRTEIDQFSKVVSYGVGGSGPASFKVWSRNGRITEYGNTANSRIEAQGLSDVNVWAANKIEDRFGNYYTVTYLEDNALGEYTPQQIDYTANDGVSISAGMHVNFTFINREQSSTTNRRDVPWGYNGGAFYKSTKLLDKVTSYVGNNKVREYDLDYAVSPVTGRTRLNQLTECGFSSDGQQTQCAQPTTMQWQDGQAGFDNSTAIGVSAVHDAGAQPMIIDTDGDGYDDLIWADQGVWWIAYGNANGGYDTPENTLITDGAADGYSDLAMPIRLGNDNRYGILVASYDTALGYGAVLWSMFTIERSTDLIFTINLTYTLGHRPLVVDMNGDGRDDVFFVTQLAASGKTTFYFHRTDLPYEDGSVGFLLLSDDTIYDVAVDEFDLFGAFPFDYNGDGLTDILAKKYDGTQGRYILQAFDEGALDSPTNRVLMFSSYTRIDANLPFGDGANGNGVVMDVNGDGLGDFIVRVGNTWRIYVNEGGSFAPEINTGVQSGGQAERALVVDYDGDGILDLLVEHPANGDWRVLISAQIQQGDGTVEPSFAVVDLGQASQGYAEGITIPGDGLTTRRPEDETPMAADYNRDGLLDLVFHDGSQWQVLQHKTTKPDLLVGVTDGFGKADQFTYKPLTDSSVYTLGASASFPELNTRAAAYVVSEYKSTNGIGGLNTLNYQYEDARLHMRGRGFIGFAKRTVTNEQTNAYSVETYRQDFPYIGMLESKLDYQQNGNTIRETFNTWDSLSLNGDINQFPYIDVQAKTRFDLASGTQVAAELVNSNYDNYGNLTNLLVTTGKSVSGSGASATITGTERTVTTVNAPAAPDTANWLVSFINQAQVTHAALGTANKQVITSYARYANTLVWAAKTEFVGSGVSRTSSRSFNGLGHVTQTDVTGDNLTVRTVIKRQNYQAGRFPQTLKNAKDHTTTLQYDARFALPSSQTDPNGNIATTQFDFFGRVQQQTRADGTLTDVVYQLCGISCPANAVYSVSSIQSHATEAGYGLPPEKIYYDALRREVRYESINLQGETIVKDTAYDAQGRVDSVSLPYLAGNTPQLAQYTYDILGRETARTEANGTSVTINYTVSSAHATQITQATTLTRPNLSTTVQTRVEQSNTLGQLMEALDAGNVKTEYLYDAQGYLRRTEVDNNTATAITVVTDVAGNKISITDPDTGTTAFSYDGLGQQLTRLDANGQTITTNYDVLGRLLSRSDPDGSATWVYDTRINGIGAIAYKQSTDFRKNYFYDSLSRNFSVRTKLFGETTPYIFNYAYDGYSRLIETTYPNGFAVKTQYSTTGYKNVVKNKANGQELWRALETNAFGNISSFNLGNGLNTQTIYAPDSGRLSSIDTGLPNYNASPSPIIQRLAYQFDSLGNLYSRSSARDSSGVGGGIELLTEGFTYDTLNRVKTSTTSGLSGSDRLLSYNYNNVGNITSKTNVGNYSYGASCANGGFGVHAVCQTSGSINANYAYDNNGNMTQNGSRNIAYNVANKPEQITQGGKISSFNYDGNRKRFYQQVAESGNTVTTRYIEGGLFEEITDSASGTIKRKSYVGNFLVHIQTETFLPNSMNDELLYLHRDHLGSVESITDASATLIRRMTFDPFGDRRQDNWENTNTAFDTAIIDASFNLTSSGFTGHEHLDGHDLIHMGGRLYDPVLGRFTSADPYIQAPTFSQSFNRYSYVVNNPLSYVDPTGYIYEISIAAGGGFSGFGGGFSGFNSWMWQPQPVFYFSPSIFTQVPFQPSIPAPQVANFGAATQTADANAQVANQPNNFVEQASGNPPAATQDGFHNGQPIQEIVVPARIDKHFDRNLNQPNPWLRVENVPKQWFENWGETGTHNIGTSGNQDWRGTKPDKCLDSRCRSKQQNPYQGWQLIYDKSGGLVTDPVNEGTFDYGRPGTLDHINQDVTPWIDRGNGSLDITTREQRIDALPRGIRWYYD